MAKLPLIDYESHARRPHSRTFTTAVGVTACSVGLVAGTWPLAALWRFNQIPAGTAIVPMRMEMLIFLCAAASLFVAMPLSCWCIYRSRIGGSRLALGFAALLLSVLGTFGGYAIYFAIIHMRNFVLEG